MPLQGHGCMHIRWSQLGNVHCVLGIPGLHPAGQLAWPPGVAALACPSRSASSIHCDRLLLATVMHAAVEEASGDGTQLSAMLATLEHVRAAVDGRRNHLAATLLFSIAGELSSQLSQLSQPRLPDPQWQLRLIGDYRHLPALPASSGCCCCNGTPAADKLFKLGVAFVEQRDFRSAERTINEARWV